MQFIIAVLRALCGIKAPGVEAAPAATSSRFQACLAEVLRHEGGYADHPATLAALASAPGAVEVITDLCDARMRFLRSLSTWPTFGGGWTRRVAEVEAAAAL